MADLGKSDIRIGGNTGKLAGLGLSVMRIGKKIGQMAEQLG